MSDTVAACPECDAARVTCHAPGGMSANEGEPLGRYRCTDCGAHFDSFVERQPRQETQTLRGLAKQLADADPDEVSAE